VCLLATFALLAVTTACSINVKSGALPPTEQLQNLTLGVSSAPDVIRILGVPKGRGMGQLSLGMKPRSIWSYEYAERQGRQIYLKMLLVFFEEDRYDGHLWFAGSSVYNVK
jgi:hypothetical protein